MSNTTDNSQTTSIPDSPVTTWLRQLETGDQEAAQPLYEHFLQRLQVMARTRIPANIRTAYDQDDVVASAFQSLFTNITTNRYELTDRFDIWRLLITIAERKITRRIKYEQRDKRDVRRLVRASVMQNAHNGHLDSRGPGVEALPAQEPTPEFAVEVAETCDNLLSSLPCDICRQIAQLKLQRHTADEIASHLGCTRRTVQRKLLVIRKTWQHLGQDLS